MPEYRSRRRREFDCYKWAAAIGHGHIPDDGELGVAYLTDALWPCFTLLYVTSRAAGNASACNITHLQPTHVSSGARHTRVVTVLSSCGTVCASRARCERLGLMGTYGLQNDTQGRPGRLGGGWSVWLNVGADIPCLYVVCRKKNILRVYRSVIHQPGSYRWVFLQHLGMPYRRQSNTRACKRRSVW